MEVLLRKSGFQFTDKVVEEMIQICDINHDGVIEYHEFVEANRKMLGLSKRRRPGAGVDPYSFQSVMSARQASRRAR